MTSNILPSSNNNKELIDRLMILEKFIELKSNECAYYRTKVHLMQMSSFNSEIIKKNSIKKIYQNNKRSSSEDISHSSIKNQNQSNKHRRSSIPLSSSQRFKKNLNNPHHSNSSILFDQSIKSKYLPFTSSIRRHRKEINDKIYAQNQNYSEEIFSHPNQKSFSSTNNQNFSLLTKDKNLINQILISYINKHLQQPNVHDKIIQCNDNDFHSIETSSKSSQTVLIIRLPRRFIKSLIEQQKKPITSKLKVQMSSQLLNQLFQSIHFNSINTKKKFRIQSQFGTIAASINHEDSIDIQQSKTVHAKAEVKTHHESRSPIIRHLARTKSDDSDRKKIIIEKNLHTISHKHRHDRRKKRHLHKLNSTSYEEINSKKSSLTNVTQAIETLPSSDQTSNSISIENNKINKNKRN